MPDQRSLDNAFDLRARAELALAFDPGQPPAQLFRHTPLLARRGVRRSACSVTTSYRTLSLSSAWMSCPKTIS